MTSARSTTVRVAAGVTVSLLALTACGGDDSSATPTTSATTSSVITTPEPSATTGSTSPATSAPPATTPPIPTPSETATVKPIKVKVSIKAGVVTTAEDTVPVTAGDTVIITVKTDITDELHVHGVEQSLNIAPGVKNQLTVTIPADLAPGQYEVETHINPLLLFTLQVT